MNELEISSIRRFAAVSSPYWVKAILSDFFKLLLPDY